MVIDYIKHTDFDINREIEQLLCFGAEIKTTSTATKPPLQRHTSYFAILRKTTVLMKISLTLT